ncbi:MAG: ACT domain-containing protein [Candidatus Bathyarchaeia archaeon]
MGEEIVVVALGRDKPGLVAGVTSLIAEAGGNIEDMDQVVLSGIFVMSLVVKFNESSAKKAELKKELVREGKKLGLKVQVYERRVLEVL